MIRTGTRKKIGCDHQARFFCVELHRSMEKLIILFFLEHIWEQSIKSVRPEEHKLHLLYGHKSQSGAIWLDFAQAACTEVLKSPSNTRHVLQDCEDTIKKKFKEAVFHTRDQISSKSLVDFGYMHLNLILRIAGFRALSRPIFFQDFIKAYLWPLYYHFVQRYEPKSLQELHAPERNKHTSLIEDLKRSVINGASARKIFENMNTAVRNAKSKASKI